MGERQVRPSARSGSSGPAGSVGSGRGGDAERSEAWQQALAELVGRPGGYNPEELAELARRAGISDPNELANLARSFSRSAATLPAGVPMHLLFVIGDTICALPAEAVQGVERIAEVTPVPNTAAWVLGVVQVWGTIVSVVDLPSFLGLPPQPPALRGRLVVVNSGDLSVGFLIPGGVEMHALGENLRARVNPSAAPDWLRPYALGAVADGERTVVVLDPARLLASEKLQSYQIG